MVKPSVKPPRASTSQPPKASRKRAPAESDDDSATLPTDSLGLGDAQLAFGSDDEVEDEGEEAEEETGDEDDFPEVDLEEGSEDETEDGDDELDSDDEAALLAELEAEEAEDALTSSDGSDVDEFIRRHTVKPDERDAETIKHDGWEDNALLPGYMQRSHTVTSKITGQDMTKWDEEIDAGYGSDSSTEEVSHPPCEYPRRCSY